MKARFLEVPEGLPPLSKLPLTHLSVPGWVIRLLTRLLAVSFCFLCKVTRLPSAAEVAILRPGGRMWPGEQFHPAAEPSGMSEGNSTFLTLAG